MQPELAATLEAYAAGGPPAFYAGAVAPALRAELERVAGGRWPGRPDRRADRWRTWPATVRSGATRCAAGSAVAR